MKSKYLISTIFESIFFTKKLAERIKSKIIYFAQGYEFYFLNGTRYGEVEASFWLADYVITISDYLKNNYNKLFGIESHKVANGIDYNILHVDDKKKNDRPSIIMNYRDEFLKAGFILDHAKINKVVDESINKLRIKTPSSKEHIANLSGGNQQKVIVSRWLANDPDILIMDEPTRGIDVGAKHEIYEIMTDLAKQGKAIIMISSEMAELLGMSDRVVVMCNGKKTGEIDTEDEMTQEKVMSYATMF
jgi:ABC-type dipeptide/oligopeptide/nickel transport system ATPase component